MVGRKPQLRAGAAVVPRKRPRDDTELRVRPQAPSFGSVGRSVNARVELPGRGPGGDPNAPALTGHGPESSYPWRRRRGSRCFGLWMAEVLDVVWLRSNSAPACSPAHCVSFARPRLSRQQAASADRSQGHGCRSNPSPTRSSGAHRSLWEVRRARDEESTRCAQAAPIQAGSGCRVTEPRPAPNCSTTRTRTSERVASIYDSLRFSM